VLFISLTSLVDNGGADIDRIFMGISVDAGTIQSDSGGGGCWETANAKQYFFWIRVDSGLAYRYVDCDTNIPITDWTLD
jgi:hypothetical protein